MIYVRIPKSKPKLKPKAEREQYDEWVKIHEPKKPVVFPKKEQLQYKLSVPAGRETRHIPSLNSGLGVATKAPPKVYTGDKMLGIATMHKSNAVPVFNSEAAVEISSMRR